MRKQAKRLIIFILLMTFSMTNQVYAQGPVQTAPFGPRVTDLKNKQDILNNFQQIKTIRSNLTVIDIKSDSTPQELQAVNIQNYIEQMQGVRDNLQKHINTYGDSFSDVFFSEQIMLIAESYIISMRHQQFLIRSIENNLEDSKNLFYSSYLIPVYYYLTLGDQMTAYIDVYLVI